MKIYALLVGINKYPAIPLSQCVNDVEKVKEYLTSLKRDHKVYIKTLTDEGASRKDVIKQIKSHLGKATDEDVALFYFSGHGGQEQTSGVFPDEHDGLLETLVCYAKDRLDTSQMLANKELRYLLHHLPNNPHLVTIVDACHSGDIVRSAVALSDSDSGAIRRISGAFEARKYNAFVFAKDESVKRPKAGGFDVYIPFKNHVHLGACLSSESSWEDAQGGVFTRYLLTLLEQTKGNLRYTDIAHWAKISMHNVTKKQQTPLISVQGKGKLSAQSSWLNLHPEGVTFPDAEIVRRKDGWIYTQGSLLGVTVGMPVLVSIEDSKTITLQVESVDLDFAKLLVPDDFINVLKKDLYPARTEINTFSPVRIAINPIDEEADTETTIRKLLHSFELVDVTEKANADFWVNIFNGLVYVSLPEHEFQPLARQIDLSGEDVKESLGHQLTAVVKWNHFYSLDNPAKDYVDCPIEVNVETGDGVRNIANQTYRVSPVEDDTLEGGEQYQTLRISVKNASREKLYVGVLTLGSDFSITSNPFNQKVIELQPGESKVFYDHEDDSLVWTTFDPYKEVYNWKEEWFYYKFIYNNFEDFTTSLSNAKFLQPALDPPLTIQTDRDVMRGEVSHSKVKKVEKKWGTCRTRIELANGTYNQITGDLEDLLDQYVEHPLLSPFILELYFDKVWNGTKYELVLKQNKDAGPVAASKATNNKIVQLLNKIYNISRRRKFRRQKHRSGPVVVAEGDSWFLFPKPGVRDTLDYIMDHYRLLSLADAGDEITDYVKNKELLDAVLHEEPDYVLISGGGNDILGEAVRDILQTNIPPGKDAVDYLKKDVFDDKVKALHDAYEMFFEKIKALKPGINIFIHGYDYIRSNPDAKTIKNGWANRYMLEKNIHDPDDRKKIILYLVDTFNTMLKDFDVRHAHVHYVDHRGTVGLNEWMDEIHPNNVGYGKVANNFLSAMKQVG